MMPDALAQTGLVLEGVGLAVAGRQIVSDVTLHLTERRIGIVGRNGSGKTTLLRLIAGLVAPSSGRVRVEGCDPALDRRAALARIGILFQNPDHQILFPTVAEELAFGLRQMGRTPDEARQAALGVLAREGRGHWAEIAVASLSQGQRQMVCLMAVLAMEPHTLLLDEPFAWLDLPARLRLMRRLDALGQRIVMISHDPGALAGMERVIWLEAGRVRQDGSAQAVLGAYELAMTELGEADADTDLPG